MREGCQCVQVCSPRKWAPCVHVPLCMSMYSPSIKPLVWTSGLAMRASNLALVAPGPCCWALPALVMRTQSAMWAAGVTRKSAEKVEGLFLLELKNKAKTETETGKT